MQKFRKYYKLLIWCSIGIFIGRTIYYIWDYKNNTWVYEYSSAPWYTNILVNAMVTGVEVVIILAILCLSRKKK